LWENGKRIKWFTSEQVERINEGTLNYTDFFELEKSKEEAKEGIGFEPPTNFDRSEETIYKEFPEIN